MIRTRASKAVVIALTAAAMSAGASSSASASTQDSPSNPSLPCGFSEVPDGMGNTQTYYRNCSSQGVLIRSLLYYPEPAETVEACVPAHQAGLVAYPAYGLHSPRIIGSC
ncbi:hypothetical protein O7626_31150 [Micromonospora sp. WMMD1102]|uniref:hypothetical protein n=1 Tax=Micromonospora sp. WMMD1102 TaxID=3016105 RepID=UPI002415563C|nr:hypothetical protein [Micromonospora sp. WMMD1102]MDG4790327.1 hypothetical protein [Micromonospora sp. WMMD1102]